MKTEERSLYYPPRAKWYHRLIRIPPRLCQRFEVLKFMPAPFEFLHTTLGLLVPGFSVFSSGMRWFGIMMFLGYLEAAACLVVFLGYPAARACLIVMLVIHALSIFHLIRPITHRWGPGARILAYFFGVVLLSAGLYVPLTDHLITRYALPLAVTGRVVVVEPGKLSPNLKVGDVIAYRYDDNGARYGPLNGYGLEKIMAVPGDTVVFAMDHLEINGKVLPRDSRMPKEGTLVVPRDHWFIWPTTARISHISSVNDAGYLNFVRSIAMVPQSRYVGQPYKRWFWRKQEVS